VVFYLGERFKAKFNPHEDLKDQYRERTAEIGLELSCDELTARDVVRHVMLGLKPEAERTGATVGSQSTTSASAAAESVSAAGVNWIDAPAEPDVVRLATRLGVDPRGLQRLKSTIKNNFPDWASLATDSPRYREMMAELAVLASAQFSLRTGAARTVAI